MKALAAQLAMNSAQMAAAQNEPDYGSDDDGDIRRLDRRQPVPTSATMKPRPGGSRGQPQLKTISSLWWRTPSAIS